MRVLRTVTSENSAATKKPLANTSARTAAMPKARWDVSIIRGSFADSIGRGWLWQAAAFAASPPWCSPWRPCATARLGASIAEEMRVDEGVDGGLIGRF